MDTGKLSFFVGVFVGAFVGAEGACVPSVDGAGVGAVVTTQTPSTE